MPIVEAMACGTPVVASAHPSLDEACGDAAVRVDPLDVEAIAAGIREARRAARRARPARPRARGAVLVALDRAPRCSRRSRSARERRPAARRGRDRRPPAARDGREYLVLLRSPEKLGYWHLVAGGVEWGEEPAAAAARELARRPGSTPCPPRSASPLGYDLAGDPEPVRARFPAGTERIAVWPFVADAPAGWEPTLDDEHVDARWLDAEAAVALLHYPEPQGGRAEGGRVRVGIDTSPLVQTRAGTARHVRGPARARSTGRPGLELVGLAAGGTGRLATRAARRALVPVPARSRLGAARRPPLHDVPRARLAARAARRHGPRPRRAAASGGVPALAPRRPGALALRGGVRAADAIVAVSAFTRDELVALLDVPVERIRVVPNGVDPVFTAGRAGRRGRLRARGRHARAAEEPRRRGRGGAARGRRAARRRRGRLGRRRGRRAGSASRATRSSPR